MNTFTGILRALFGVVRNAMDPVDRYPIRIDPYEGDKETGNIVADTSGSYDEVEITENPSVGLLGGTEGLHGVDGFSNDGMDGFGMDNIKRHTIYDSFDDLDD